MPGANLSLLEGPRKSYSETTTGKIGTPISKATWKAPFWKDHVLHVQPKLHKSCFGLFLWTRIWNFDRLGTWVELLVLKETTFNFFFNYNSVLAKMCINLTCIAHYSSEFKSRLSKGNSKNGQSTWGVSFQKYALSNLCMKFWTSFSTTSTKNKEVYQFYFE